MINYKECEILFQILPLLKGVECWYLSSGGAVGSTFQLVLGEKVRRLVPLRNPCSSEDFRFFEGEFGLYVWCAWRLDTPDGPLTSWDDVQESVNAGLRSLIGTRIDSVDAMLPALDLDIKFSNSLRLRVFCDHVPGKPSFDGNWELQTQDVAASIGPGTKLTIDVRQ